MDFLVFSLGSFDSKVVTRSQAPRQRYITPFDEFLWFTWVYYLLWYINFSFFYQEEFQLVKHYLSSISSSRNIKLKKSQNSVYRFFDWFFFKFRSQNLLHFEIVPIKCPEQFLCYNELISRRACEKKFKSKFHVFGWFSGLQILHVFLENLLQNKFWNHF